MLTRIRCWMFNHVAPYAYLDMKFLMPLRHKKMLKTNAAYRKAQQKLNTPAYLNDPDRTLA